MEGGGAGGGGARKTNENVFRKNRGRPGIDSDAYSGSSSTQYSGVASRSDKAAGLLPPAHRNRLQGLFREIEKELEGMYLENVRLRQKIHNMENNWEEHEGGARNVDKDEPDAFEEMLRKFTKKNALKTRHKLKAHTSKIVSSFKTPGITAALVREYKGHRDGIWDISVSQLGGQLLGTASADKTARLWNVDTGQCQLAYVGHSGSVNSISFHPSQDLVLTASGDGSAHVWKSSSIAEDARAAASSEEEDSGEEEANKGRGNVLKTPIMALTGHQNVVIGCQWLDSNLAVTASWDRVANLYNIESGGTLLQTLAGHDDELTHVACHPTMRLVATCSADTTFRLWDFRETIHSVSVFQGHTEAVTCAAFCRSDQIVSGSDDRSVKVWDLRNMRAPVTSIQTPSPVNRLAVSVNGTIAIPHDNRHVVLYDLTGQKLLRLPRDSSSHNRMVTSTCWATPDHSDRSKANLFSAGFDRVAFGWSVKAVGKEREEERGRSKAAKEATL